MLKNKYLSVKGITLSVLLLFISSHTLYAESGREIINFNDAWLFKRYGLQADGSRVTEPQQPSPQDILFDEQDWRQLNLPHDWAIEGPFDNSLDGYTGKHRRQQPCRYFPTISCC